MNKLLYFLIITLFAGCSTSGNSVADQPQFKYRLDTLTLYDQSRQRAIPVAVYKTGLQSIRKTETGHFQSWLWTE